MGVDGGGDADVGVAEGLLYGDKFDGLLQEQRRWDAAEAAVVSLMASPAVWPGCGFVAV
ncbi:hypothetical protein [Streptomyces celluloflavus]|uniref:hypothetical protein n=1 Tax=Streptomyces TaxID=1883 RepID=UPI00167D7B71